MHTSDRFTVGILYLDRDGNLLTEAPSVPGYVNASGNFKNKSKAKVYVYESEGPIPHCHFVDDSLGIEICVRLDKPEYFNHGGKQQKFPNKRLRNTFAEFMESTAKIGGRETVRWDLAALDWNGANEDYIIPENTKMPDYRKLDTEK